MSNSKVFNKNKVKKPNLVLVQNIHEFNQIKSKIKERFFCVPLNLDLLVHCKMNDIPYINPIKYLNNDIHTEGLKESELFLKNVNLKKYKLNVVNARYKNLIRNYFNSCFFVNSLVSAIKKKHQISKIIVSGWSRDHIYVPRQNYILSEICNSLFKNVHTISRKKLKPKTDIYSYKLSQNWHKDSKSTGRILFLNFGYNFKKIVFRAFIKKKKMNFITFEKISVLKKLIFKILGIKYFIYSKYKKKNFISKKFTINKKYKMKNIQNLINRRSIFFHLILAELISRCDSIKELITKLKPKVVFLNLVRGVDGYLAELSKELNFSSVVVPHGTVSKSFNKYDKIYKKIIAENVFSGESKYFVAQTKIAEGSSKTHKLKGKVLKIGNIIFSNVSRSSHKKKFFLYAVTMKDFINYQFYGVEMYYEFYENLKNLDKIAAENKIKFLVKPHPSISYLTEDLKKLFKNLDFSNKRIDELLKSTIATISFSSTVIEDSICSKIPVILYDQWKRYKHCDSCSNVNKTNELIYYVNTSKELLKVIRSISKSKSFNYSKYIFSKIDPSKNIDKLIYRFSM